MSMLQPDRIARRYAELVELGRSRLPALAPLHTDHNAHDPGITLMELLAAVAEAQLYSAGRIRRDERAAYAALFGVHPQGTRPARGLLWPDRARPDSPANTVRDSIVIDAQAEVRMRDRPELQFRPVRPILWVPGAIRRLALRDAAGSWREFSALNERGAGFLPFGERAGPSDVLVMSFATAAEGGLLPVGRAMPVGACWSVGVRVAASSVAAEEAGTVTPSPLTAVLITGQGRHSLPILEDTSAGMLRSGHILLDLSALRVSPATFSIEWRAPRGLARVPRVLHIAPNVLPITQRREIRDELPPANGQPGFTCPLSSPGLCFEPDAEPLVIASRHGAEVQIWRRCADLANEGPTDRVFELDSQAERLRFGNGVNGVRPTLGQELTATYAVSDGDEGNVARNRSWIVTGIDGIFGSNLDPVSGGAGRSDLQSMRRESRRRLDEDRALVSAADICRAAESLPLLEVARSWVAPAGTRQAQTATLRLVAMRARSMDAEPAQAPETPRWLKAIRDALAPRMPLGTRLSVVAPRYQDLSVRAALVVTARSDPERVREAARAALVERLRLVPRRTSDSVRAPGATVTRRDVMVWLLAVPGVADVASLDLIVDGQSAGDTLSMPPNGLPRLDIDASEIEARRAPAGAQP